MFRRHILGIRMGWEYLTELIEVELVKLVVGYFEKVFLI